MPPPGSPFSPCSCPTCRPLVDPAAMPGRLRGFTEHHPVTPVVDSIPGLLTGSGASSAMIAVAWSVGITVVFAVAASWAFASRTRR